MPSPTAIAILEFGRLLHNEDRCFPTSRDPARIAQIQETLITQLTAEKSALLKKALNYGPNTPIDPVALRIMSLIGYEQLCTNKLVIGLTDILKAVAGDAPAPVLEARQIVSKLLLNRQLILREHAEGCVELGQQMLDYLSGGKESLPVAITESGLRARWRREEKAAAQRQRSNPISFETYPTAKQLAEKISLDVVGLDAQVRTIASRLALHMRRAALLKSDNDPGSPNEVLLFIGPSGCGKTWLAETSGKVCGVPFAAMDTNSLTAEGYIGLKLDDPLKEVFLAANQNPELVRSSILFFDEVDKRRVSGSEHGTRDIGGAAVQQAMLRVLEGCEYQLGGRRGSHDWDPTMVNTRGMFFTLAGAFVGLEKLLHKRSAHGIGFGSRADASLEQQYLYDALVDFGMMPEFVNRLSGILVFPEPSIDQLIQIAEWTVIPSCRRLLATCGADLQITREGVQLMADCAAATKTYARGLKSIIAKLVDDAVFEGRTGVINLDAEAVRQAIEASGMGLETAHK